MDTQSIGALIQNFLLLSTENGISTLWINDIFYAKKEIENFYVDNTMEIVAAVAVGYSSSSKLELTILEKSWMKSSSNLDSSSNSGYEVPPPPPPKLHLRTLR